MAYKQTGTTTAGNIKEYQGKSTDTKPTDDVGYGSTYYEVDTKLMYIYDSNINPTTSNGWWPL